MKKTFLHLIIFCLAGSLVSAQDYGKTGEKMKSEVAPEEPVFFSGYKPSPYGLKPYRRASGDLRYKSSAALPSKYDLREENMVTGAKNQNPGGGPEASGNCTAFSSIGSIESRWLKMGLPAPDLSEQNLAACNGFDEENWGYGQGANQYVCSAYLTRGDGPVSEADDPYNTSNPNCNEGLARVAIVPDSRFLPVRDQEVLKHTIYNYGAVYVGIYWDVSGSSYNAADFTYHYSGISAPNHAVLVCGWDDDIATAGGTGAWIVKNSWGTAWGDNGFFYISYQDSRIAGDEVAFYPKRWDNHKVDTMFIHDELGFTSTYTAPNTSEFFELAKFDAGSPHLITHVGVGVPEPETVLDFKVWDDFDGENLSNLLGSRSELYVDFPGIHTFELPVQVSGDFYIEVRRQTGNNDLLYPVEIADEGFSDPVFNPDVNWFKREASGTWRSTYLEATQMGFNLTIRAYAKKTNAPRALISVNKTHACVLSDVVYTYLDNNDADSWEWEFGEGADIATASTKGPHTIKYATLGTKTVKLIVSGPSGSDTLVGHDIVDVTDAIHVNILSPTIEIPFGESADITAYGADEYSWDPASLVDNATGQTVVVTPPALGSYTLTVLGRQGEWCGSSDEITIHCTDPPPNDDMCDALFMPDGFIGTFSNENASAEPGEPSPDEGEPGSGDCLRPMKWCFEDGVQVHNSMWYWFYGPETGIASIETSGMDNQIAIYRADTCTEIIKDSLKAANDDYTEQVPEGLAATIDALEVIPGARYFLQVDGSFGGAKGSYTIVFNKWGVGIEEENGPDLLNPYMNVYPNPGYGIFTIHLQDLAPDDTWIYLYNLNGQLVHSKKFRGLPEVLTRFDISLQPAGVYHLRAVNGSRIMNRKIIKK